VVEGENIHSQTRIKKGKPHDNRLQDYDELGLLGGILTAVATMPAARAQMGTSGTVVVTNGPLTNPGDRSGYWSAQQNVRDSAGMRRWYTQRQLLTALLWAAVVRDRRWGDQHRPARKQRLSRKIVTSRLPTRLGR
jgi:hypothetical protein